MSESFVKPFTYLYEESDKVIEQGTKIPAVNQWGKTPDIEEQTPVEIVVQTSTTSIPQPPSEPTTSEPKPEPSVTTSTPTKPISTTPIVNTKPGKNVSIGVSDNVASTDQ